MDRHMCMRMCNYRMQFDHTHWPMHMPMHMQLRMGECRHACHHVVYVVDVCLALTSI